MIYNTSSVMSSSTINMQNTNYLQANFSIFGNLLEYGFSVIESHQSIFSSQSSDKVMCDVMEGGERWEASCCQASSWL